MNRYLFGFLIGALLTVVFLGSIPYLLDLDPDRYLNRILAVKQWFAGLLPLELPLYSVEVKRRSVFRSTHPATMPQAPTVFR